MGVARNTNRDETMANKKRKSALKINSVSRGIERDIMKENGSLMRSRGRHSIHTSQKRKSRSIDRKKAIKDNVE